VGSLANAALVISRLHRGKKRLVFVDSRARVEQLAVELRGLGVTTFVSHGSLGREQRRQAEAAFAQERDCVIVATSTLELGIDVGDLDRVIQIDAPGSVASFLQRLGRTGRRPGSSRNCLFLATDEEAFLVTAGLVRLWSQGYVEPTSPPPTPYHLVAQQLMAVALQQGGVGRSTWLRWMGEPFVFGAEAVEAEPEIVAWMLEHGLLHDDGGIVGVGPTGEEEYGRRHFSELMSVFTSAPMFSVRHGRNEIGQVPTETLELADEDPRVFLLGGRAWAVAHVEWNRRIVDVVPTEERGRARWFGSGRPLSAELCQAIREVLRGAEVGAATSNRADEQLDRLRAEFRWVPEEGTVLVTDAKGRVRWWTFAGLLGNAWLSQGVATLRDQVIQRDNLAINLAAGTTVDDLRGVLDGLVVDDLQLGGLVDEEAMAGLKFEACLPRDLIADLMTRRLDGRSAAGRAASSPLRGVTLVESP
jgi:ATP-dependent helicase Lhr and Lhr-like helicase